MDKKSLQNKHNIWTEKYLWTSKTLHVDLDYLPVSSCDDTLISSCVSPLSTEFLGSSEFWVLFLLPYPLSSYFSFGPHDASLLPLYLPVSLSMIQDQSASQQYQLSIRASLEIMNIYCVIRLRFPWRGLCLLVAWLAKSGCMRSSP